MAAQPHRRKRFSLVELVVSMFVLSILAAVTVPDVDRRIADSRIGSFKCELQAIQASVLAIQSDLRVFPADAPREADPGVLSNAAVPCALCAVWKGPYISRWPRRHPFGGAYDFECGRNDAFNYDGLPGNEVFLAAQGGLRPDVLERVDADLDDGVACSGRVRHDGVSCLWLYLGEGASWTAAAEP